MTSDRSINASSALGPRCLHHHVVRHERVGRDHLETEPHRLLAKTSGDPPESDEPERPATVRWRGLVAESSQRPSRTARSSGATPRANERDQREGVIGDLVDAIVGHVGDQMPREVATGRSIVSTPMPYRAMITQSSSRSMTSAGIGA